MHHLTAALRAHGLFKREVDYIVKDGEVIIVDEFTGRTMIGRRWSDGLHQAVEAKEGVRVKEENQTVASITFQNYFRMYGKLAGMTGTADTEAYEFQQIYGLEVVVIPTHKTMIRDDAPDLVYLTQKDKFDAIIEDINDCQQARPARARRHDVDRDLGVPLGPAEEEQDPAPGAEREIPRARSRDHHAGRPPRHRDDRDEHGRPRHRHQARRQSRGRARQARGADDERGRCARARGRTGSERHAKVIEMGGLHIVGTERHESRRIDNQLRGRSGRQGDPGSSRFYLSLEDNLMRIFGDPERIKRMLSRAGMKPGEAIESKLLSRQIERAQRKVEAHNFDIRKQLLEYDDVANDQRKRRLSAALGAHGGRATSPTRFARSAPRSSMPPSTSTSPPRERRGRVGQGRLEQGARARVRRAHGRRALARERPHDRREAAARARRRGRRPRPTTRSPPRSARKLMHELEKQIMLRQLDSHWKEHIGALDYLRQGIHLRGYAQRNPKQEYKREAFEMFSSMLERVKHDTISILSKIQIRRPEDVQAVEPAAPDPSTLRFQHAAAPSLVGRRPRRSRGRAAPQRRTRACARRRPPPSRSRRTCARQPKVGRNDPCPCGSGKKFKQCHGRLS